MALSQFPQYFTNMIFEKHKKSVEFFRTHFAFEIPGIYHRHWPVTEIDGGIVHRGIFTTHRFSSADNESKTGQRWQAELFHLRT